MSVVLSPASDTVEAGRKIQPLDNVVEWLYVPYRVNPQTTGGTSLKIKVVALGSVVEVELAAGATIADAARDARVDDTLECRYRGRSVSPTERSGVRVEDGDTLVFTPPAVKHGS